ncbi:MAG: UDP-N-acetylmuramoyl-L-alanyl-D-glutamate--2,6-diaminopimelate ligase [Candidatus Omnitrophota bacterium]
MPEKINGLAFNRISDDSRNVVPGDLFFALQGARHDGTRFIDEALTRGAAAVIIAHGASLQREDPRIIRVEDPRSMLAEYAARFYRFPSRRLKVIGITGTNGKTTVSYLVRAIMTAAGKTPGVVGTIAHSWKDKTVASVNTTPGALEVQRLLNAMAEDGVICCAMEVSSHALDQGRVLGIDFTGAIFTNLTGEHLDYHGTIEKYLAAKARLFTGLGADRYAVINADDACYGYLRQATSARVISYGLTADADLRAEEIALTDDGTRFLVRDQRGSWSVTTPLIGLFNVYNILAAIACARAEGCERETIREALRECTGADGRLERVDPESGRRVYVDYAHTDDALENVLMALKAIAPRKIILVFGCGGDRDRSKRPRMGKVASRLADYVIITSDNPRSEDPALIAREIERGIEQGFTNYEMIPDRSDAIARAVRLGGAEDVVVIAGKGHERNQIIGSTVTPFSDKEVARLMISRYKGGGDAGA